MISSIFLVCAYRASGWIENHQYKSKIRTHLRLRRCGSDYLALVDSKGIEPSNLTDANRALSQMGRKYCCNTNEIVSKITEKYERKEQMMMNLFPPVRRTE